MKAEVSSLLNWFRIFLKHLPFLDSKLIAFGVLLLAVEFFEKMISELR